MNDKTTNTKLERSEPAANSSSRPGPFTIGRIVAVTAGSGGVIGPASVSVSSVVPQVPSTGYAGSRPKSARS